MASLISGYNYDIFISYRQKDNKYDGWVTKFVDNLRKELEATFKEDVSVYFDENPHDRLQETFDVDKSLEGKLKCLIFIPILSQTYCDPNSYAWQHEFLAFLQMVKNDRFGKDVKLRSSNVASRILPIRIHDLEPEDVKLFEKETGSVLRAMDFVFKTGTGAIRPLLPNEDHPNDNLYKTFYRDQISKVAIAIKEIVLAMKVEPVLVEKEKAQTGEPLQEVRKVEKMELQEKPAKLSKSKLLIGVAILVVLVVAAIIVYPKIFKRNTFDWMRASGERISLVVLPFQNMTNDTTRNYWQDVIQIELISFLSVYTKELNVKQLELISSLLQGKGFSNYATLTPSAASLISSKLDAEIVITGNIIPAGPNIRLTAQVIDSRTKEILKPFQIEGPNKEEEILRMADSLSFKIRDFLIISNLEESLLPEYKFSGRTTNSPDAYKYYVNAFKSFMKGDVQSSVISLTQAIEKDSNFIDLYLYGPFIYLAAGRYDQAKNLCKKVYGKKTQIPKIQQILVEFAFARCFGTPYDEIKYIRQILEEENQSAGYTWQLGKTYCVLNQYDDAIPLLEKSLKMWKKQGIKPEAAFSYTILGEAYHKNGWYRKEEMLYKKACQDFPDDDRIIRRQAILALTVGEKNSANEYIEKYKSIRKENSASEAAIDGNLASIYSEAGILDKAEEYYQQALSREPESSNIMNTLAYFLIDKDRNVNEGMDFVENALQTNPDNYNYLHTKGWGLYKQGKYQEALKILQKSWDIRRYKAIYNHEAFLHLEAAKKTVGGQK